MFFPTKISTRRMSVGRVLAVLALILLPFPVSIPLALWLTGHRHLPSSPRLPPPPPDKAA